MSIALKHFIFCSYNEINRIELVFGCNSVQTNKLTLISKMYSNFCIQINSRHKLQTERTTKLVINTRRLGCIRTERTIPVSIYYSLCSHSSHSQRQYEPSHKAHTKERGGIENIYFVLIYKILLIN